MKKMQRSPDAPRPVHAGLIGLLFAACAMAGCSLAGTDGDVVAGVDLDELFAPAEADEVERAAEEWADRDVSARGVELVLEDQLRDPFGQDWQADLRVYGHDVGGFKHYGAVVVPAVEPARERPVLLFLHGDDDGVSMSQVALALAFLPELRDEYVVVVPSFQSEPLDVGEQSFRSGGPASPWDRDVDDTIALLNVALESTPAADPDRIVALGFSRGAAVGLLAAIRDDRIDGVASFFGPTDFLGDFARDVTRRMLRGDLPNLPGISTLNDTLLEPLQEGDLGMDEVRLELIRRSAVYFIDRLPAVQIHHGLNDTVVPAAEGEALAARLEGEGRTDYEAFFYTGGVHDPLSLNGALDRLSAFLIQWTSLPA